MDDLVEEALRGAALWDEVKDKLKQSGYSLSGGQQQRLCIARTIAIQPDIILMDEPCSALDPIATLRIEELMRELVQQLHHHHRHAQHAAGGARLRFHRLFHGHEDRTGYLEEFGVTKEMFTSPKSQVTEDYITGRFG